MLDVPEPLQDFAPGSRVLESLYVHQADDPGAGASYERNSLRFSRWAVNAETLNWYEDPFIPPPKRTSATPIAPNHEPSVPAVPAAPFPRLPPNSQQKKGETIQAFFIRRSEANRKKMANKSPVDRQRRTSRAAHALKGGVPSKGSVFLWEKVDGHYIRQPQIRGEFPDLWDGYPGPQRRFDPFHNEWDLCELFANNDPVFGEGFSQAPDSDDEIDATDAIFPQNIDMASRLAPTDTSTNVDTNMEIVHEEHPRNAVQEHPSRRQEHSNFEFEFLNGDYVPGDDELSPYTMESDLPKRDLAKASKECMSLRPKAAPTGFTINREYLTSMRNPAERMYYYVLAEDGSGIGSEVLLFPRATDVLEVLRQGWGPDIKGVIKHLLARGIPFWLAYRSLQIMPKSTPAPAGLRPKGFKVDTTSGLGFRPHEHKFDEHDYRAYTTRQDLQLLHTPRGRIAMQYGGVVARLARSEVSDDDFFRGFDDDIYDVGDCLWDETSKHAYWYDRLSDHEIDLLCGVYHVGTGM
ncbi:hypothetical protein DFH08DRAFT_722307 [Mycena albidolilacea]|uniref:Uncharacterized protein n=1 Tax=Mycena albidolilacea TaxID=1033008 RepID=A0AAD6Z1Z9_9AGAR|nr:hypothetical protein DFH08DRAFT_722307 [Mycena albidolilacea]